ncbi:hypothetical protein SUGI_0873910 [Cryptomeria japonica]|nr:hypothetical protein SUGI_0873910 [Cryptomeria japonica]
MENTIVLSTEVAFTARTKKTMPWAMHCTPPLDMMISPLKELIDDDNAPLYEEFCFQDYLEKYFTEGLARKEQINERKR